MCDFIKNVLQESLPPHIMAAMDAVIVDKSGRCYCQYNLEEFGSLSLTSSEWGEVKVMQLITEVVHVMDAALELQIKEIAWLREDSKLVGCILPFMLDVIFVKPANVLHPLDAVSTVIHELAHIYVEQCGHKHKGSESHCMAWEKTTRYLTVIFGVSKILWWMLFSWHYSRSNIHICK